MPADPARVAYEARWAGMTLGPRGAAPAWDDLGPEGRAVWERVAEAAIAVALPSLLATLIRRAWRPWRERMHLALPTGARVALLEEVARAQQSVPDGARPVVWRTGEG
jgi:hypothetical protein